MISAWYTLLVSKVVLSYGMDPKMSASTDAQVLFVSLLAMMGAMAAVGIPIVANSENNDETKLSWFAFVTIFPFIIMITVVSLPGLN